MQHKDELTLEKIIFYCDRIKESLDRFNATYTLFKEDSELQELCVFMIIQIGELVIDLNKQFVESHPEIEWNKIVVMSDYVTHDYAKIDWEIVWIAVTKNIPELGVFCKKLIS